MLCDKFIQSCIPSWNSFFDVSIQYIKQKVFRFIIWYWVEKLSKFLLQQTVSQNFILNSWNFLLLRIWYESHHHPGNYFSEVTFRITIHFLHTIPGDFLASGICFNHPLFLTVNLIHTLRLFLSEAPYFPKKNRIFCLRNWKLISWDSTKSWTCIFWVFRKEGRKNNESK